MIIRLLVLILALGLSGCSLFGGKEKQKPIAPPDPMKNAYLENGGLVAVALCDVDSVASEMDAAMTASDNIKDVYIQKRLERLSTALDAQYRSMTQACRAYAQCMQINKQDQNKCGGPERRWDSSESRFRELARDIEALRSTASRKQASDGGRKTRTAKCDKTCGEYSGLTSCCA
ncbi:MAG: hypothetical protein AAFR28_18875 [Pseudomonadota bacterium]